MEMEIEMQLVLAGRTDKLSRVKRDFGMRRERRATTMT